MKQQDFHEQEQFRQTDINLHKAVQQLHDEEPQLPADFAVRFRQHVLAEKQKRHRHQWRNIAAIFIGMTILSGAIYAAVRLADSFRLFHWPTEKAVSNVPNETNVAVEDSLVQFRNVPLDSILYAVGSHYHHTVCFLDEEPRLLRFSILWNSEKSLSDFLSNVNEFEGLHLTAERDTIFVKWVEKEGQP